MTDKLQLKRWRAKGPHGMGFKVPVNAIVEELTGSAKSIRVNKW